jgi:hypothetical protein
MTKSSARSEEPRKSVALIGSFKSHYRVVRSAMAVLQQAGIGITSPLGTDIRVPGIPFVRFESDDPALSDGFVQSLTMQRIFQADLVYVIAPRGYVGRTTCYEVGRVIQAACPIYFSDHPLDLPVEIPTSHVLSPETLAHCLTTASWEATWPFAHADSCVAELERALVDAS